MAFGNLTKKLRTENNPATPEAELRFVQALIERIRKDGCGFLPDWENLHAERAEKTTHKIKKEEVHEQP